jgi:hypothetical protein
VPLYPLLFDTKKDLQGNSISGSKRRRLRNLWRFAVFIECVNQGSIDVPACWLSGTDSQEAPAIRLELSIPVRLSPVAPLLKG